MLMMMAVEVRESVGIEEIEEGRERQEAQLK
jgi:hypothetical protein